MFLFWWLILMLAVSLLFVLAQGTFTHMQIKKPYSFIVILTTLFCVTPIWAACPVDEASPLQLQILGSGGPREASIGRASTSYLLWVDGVGRILIDAGGGSKVPFHEAGATTADIDLIALSHMHPDHVTELPALFWPPPRGEIIISGPSAGASFPSVDGFLESLFGGSGAYQILFNRLNYTPLTIDASSTDVVDVWTEGNIVVRGKSVPHGDVPAIGYRVDIGDHSIAFSSDQNGSDPSWTEFIRGVDVLVVHFGTEENRDSPFHAKPSLWGQMATDASAGQVIISHITTSEELEAGEAHLRSTYDGPVTVAEDLMCIEVI